MIHKLLDIIFFIVWPFAVWAGIDLIIRDESFVSVVVGRALLVAGMVWCVLWTAATGLKFIEWFGEGEEL